MIIWILFVFQQCFAAETVYMDQCRGDIMNANGGGRLSRSEGYHAPEHKLLWEKCASCVTTAGKNKCSATSMAVTSTCVCNVDNIQQCKCKESLSPIGMIIILLSK